MTLTDDQRQETTERAGEAVDIALFGAVEAAMSCGLEPRAISVTIAAASPADNGEVMLMTGFMGNIAGDDDDERWDHSPGTHVLMLLRVARQKVLQEGMNLRAAARILMGQQDDPKPRQTPSPAGKRPTRAIGSRKRRHG